MALIKPKFNGKELTSSYYQGPPPVPGPYTGEVSWLGRRVIANGGSNDGEDMLVVIVKITSGQYKGAEIWHNLAVLKESGWSVNQFLEALTDGSEKQKETIKEWFWDLGYDVEPEAKKEKLGQQVNYIGKPKFKPIGKKIAFVTSMDGERAVISKFVVPLEGSGAEDPEESNTTVVEDDGIIDAVVEDEPKAEPEPEQVATDDDDDPWV